MHPINKTSFAAATASSVTAVGLVIVLYSPFELSVLLKTALGFGALAAVISFAIVYFSISRRFGLSVPVFGAARGAALALLTFVLCVVAHAVIFPGASGFVFSFFAQLIIGLLLFGW